LLNNLPDISKLKLLLRFPSILKEHWQALQEVVRM